MKCKVWTVAAVSAVLVIGVSAMLFAQQNMEGEKQGHMMGKDGMMHQSGMKGMPMMGMGGMMRTQIVPTEDGGVLVSYCNILIKYDKDLKQVAETTFTISEENMKNMTDMTKTHMKMMGTNCCSGKMSEKK